VAGDLPPGAGGAGDQRPLMGVTYCSIVDAGFLPRFLVMHEGLAAHTDGAELHVLCMDDVVHDVLSHASLAGTRLITLDVLESFRPGLEAATRERTLSETCWTAKPVLCAFLLDRAPGIDALAYVDADLAFYADPAAALASSSEWSALIVPHRAPPGATWEATHGVYNAGFVAFRGSEAREIVEWWSDRCIEWCFDRVEPTRYTDQKYLDDWPDRYRGARVLESPGMGLAPWNGRDVHVQRQDGRLYAERDRLVFYHFQSLRLYRGFTLPRRVGLAGRRYGLTHAGEAVVWAVDRSYEIPGDQAALLYAPYIRRVVEQIERVAALGVDVERSYRDLPVGEVIGEAIRDLLPGPIRRQLRRARASIDPARRRSAQPHANAGDTSR